MFRIVRATSLLLVLLGITGTASAQTWNDGSPSRLRHTCWQGIFDPIPEDLTWTWTGFEGSPVQGVPYRVHVAVGGLGCSGAWVLPQMKLPEGTTLVVDASHPIRCFYQPASTGVVEEITDGSCPTSPFIGPQPTSRSFPNPDGTNNDFLAFAPTTQPYWPLPPGVTLTIEAYVVSTGTLSGIASNDYLLGAVQVLDNSPGNPTVVDDGAPLGYGGVGIPSSGAWQGVFVFASPSLAPRIAYPLPITVALGETTATTRAVVFNTACLSPRQVRFNLLYPDLVTDPPGSGFAGGTCTPLGDGSDECVAMWTGLMPGTTYAFQATFDPATLGACPAPVGDDVWQLFSTASPPGAARHALLIRAEGPGTATLDPEGGSYPPGTTVTATAVPNAGAHFVSFVVDGTPTTTHPLTLVTDVDHDVVAHFASDTAADAGTEPGVDAGIAPGTDAGIAPGTDAGIAPGSDGGTARAPASGGCSASTSSRGSVWLVGLVILACVIGRRRRTAAGTTPSSSEPGRCRATRPLASISNAEHRVAAPRHLTTRMRSSVTRTRSSTMPVSERN
jgi:hypothetical protein